MHTRAHSLFLLNHKPIDALALTVHASNMEEMGQYWVEELCMRTTIRTMTWRTSSRPRRERGREEESYGPVTCYLGSVYES